MLLTAAILLLPIVAYRFLRLDLTPTVADKVQLMQGRGGLAGAAIKASKSRSAIFAGATRVMRPRSSVRGSTRSLKRSAYAFSHEEGFAELIKEGKMMPEPSVRFFFITLPFFYKVEFFSSEVCLFMAKIEEN